MLFGFWVFGLPTSSILVFKYGMGPIGFWTGQVLANSFDFIVLTIIALNSNWNKNIARMSIRMDRSRKALITRERFHSFDKFSRPPRDEIEAFNDPY